MNAQTNAIETALHYWPIILATVGIVVWLVRLEAKGLTNEKAIKSVSDQRLADAVSAQAQRDEIMRMIDAMRKEMHDAMAEIRGYIMKGRQ